MAPMYDEDEDIWTGAGLSRDIANQRLAERKTLPTGPSSFDRKLGAVKGAFGGATTGAQIGSLGGPVGTAIGAGVGALLGGKVGSMGASVPSESDVKGGMGFIKKAYDEYKKLKSPGPTSDLGENVKELSDLGIETGMV